MSGCLALNSSYEPLTVMTTKRAVRLLLQGKAELVEQDGDKVLRSERNAVPRPSVIRLKQFVKVPKRFRKAVTNTFLFARDQYTCQYCGKHEGQLVGRTNKLTRDHILPQSRGGGNTWDNCVTACSQCNAKKDDKLPVEAGMQLLSVPTEPHMVALQWSVRKLTEKQRYYITMFYGDEVLKALE